MSRHHWLWWGRGRRQMRRDVLQVRADVLRRRLHQRLGHLLPRDERCKCVVAVRRGAAWGARRTPVVISPPVVEAEARTTARRLTSRMGDVGLAISPPAVEAEARTTARRLARVVGRWLLWRHRIVGRRRVVAGFLLLDGTAPDEAIGVAPLRSVHIRAAAPVGDRKGRTASLRLVAKDAPTRGRSGNGHAAEI